MLSTKTFLEPSHTTQPYTRILTRGSSKDSSSGETLAVFLRVQVHSCRNLEAKDRNGFSDPFVVVSLAGKHFKTPVCRRNLNPEYKPKDATFDFPIYTSLADKLGTLEFVVWDKDMIGKDFLGKYSLPVNQWFKGAFAFHETNNQDFSVDLDSSPRGTLRIKVGFVHPPNSTSAPDFVKTYNALINPDKDHVGIVLLEICGARDLPDWPNATRTGWDMDPFVEVSIGKEVKRTKVIRHSRGPVWNEQLLFHVCEQDLSLPIRLTVIDKDKVTSNDFVGKAELNIATLVERAAKEGLNTGHHPDLPTMHEFNLPLTKNLKRAYICTPIITFRASYQSYIALQKQARQGV
ncbi:C2 domain-containing protein [Lactarius deliciosus]|nr:C2 domain-containing protein [Lactarius deliciosus]